MIIYVILVALLVATLELAACHVSCLSCQGEAPCDETARCESPEILLAAVKVGCWLSPFTRLLNTPHMNPQNVRIQRCFFFLVLSRVYQFGRRDYNPTALSTDPYNGMKIYDDKDTLVVILGVAWAQDGTCTRCNCQWLPYFSSFFLTCPAGATANQENRYDLVSKQEAHFSMGDFPLPCLITG